MRSYLKSFANRESLVQAIKARYEAPIKEIFGC